MDKSVKKRWKNLKKTEYYEKTQAAVIFSHSLLAYWYVCKSSCSVVDCSEKEKTWFVSDDVRG